MSLLLWILAVILVVAGIIRLFQRDFLWGTVLIVVGLLVGPGGVSLFIQKVKDQLLKKIKQAKENIQAGRKEIKDLAAQRKKWEDAGSPGLEVKKK